MNRQQRRKYRPIVYKLIKLQRQLKEDPQNKQIQKQIEDLIISSIYSTEDFLALDELFTSKVDF